MGTEAHFAPFEFVQDGKVVGSQAGSAQMKALQAYDAQQKAAGKPGVKAIREYTGFDEAYADLAAGRLDAVAQSLASLSTPVKTHRDVFAVIAQHRPQDLLRLDRPQGRRQRHPGEVLQRRHRQGGQERQAEGTADQVVRLRDGDTDRRGARAVDVETDSPRFEPPLADGRRPDPAPGQLPAGLGARGHPHAVGVGARDRVGLRAGRGAVGLVVAGFAREAGALPGDAPRGRVAAGGRRVARGAWRRANGRWPRC